MSTTAGLGADSSRDDTMWGVGLHRGAWGCMGLHGGMGLHRGVLRGMTAGGAETSGAHIQGRGQTCQ